MYMRSNEDEANIFLENDHVASFLYTIRMESDDSEASISHD